jgi:hypothetical protein
MASRVSKCKKCKGTKYCPACSGSGEQKIINSRSKGSSYERRIAGLFSDWCMFKISRTPSSGGLMKTGDIFPVQPEDMVKFPFSIELKNRESWDFKELLDGPTKTGIFSFWKQCVDDASSSNRIPLLVFTKKGSSNYCMVFANDFDRYFEHSLITNKLLVGNDYVVFNLDGLFSDNFERISELWRKS